MPSIIDDDFSGYKWGNFYYYRCDIPGETYLGVEFPDSIEIKTLFFKFFLRFAPSEFAIYAGDSDNYLENTLCFTMNDFGAVFFKQPYVITDCQTTAKYLHMVAPDVDF